MVEVGDSINTSSIEANLPVLPTMNTGGLAAQVIATAMPDSEDTAFLNANGE